MNEMIYDDIVYGVRERERDSCQRSITVKFRFSFTLLSVDEILNLSTKKRKKKIFIEGIQRLDKIWIFFSDIFNLFDYLKASLCERLSWVFCESFDFFRGFLFVYKFSQKFTQNVPRNPHWKTVSQPHLTPLCEQFFCITFVIMIKCVVLYNTHTHIHTYNHIIRRENSHWMPVNDCRMWRRWRVERKVWLKENKKQMMIAFHIRCTFVTCSLSLSIHSLYFFLYVCKRQKAFYCPSTHTQTPSHIQYYPEPFCLFSVELTIKHWSCPNMKF